MSIQQLTFGNSKRVIATATGGTVTYDGDYAVHTFASSGTFTITYRATSGLTYNLLCLGGGANGDIGTDVTGGDTSGGIGGGGGNGGPCCLFSSLSMDAFTAASVTVGAANSAYSQFFGGGAVLYSSVSAGFTQASGGSGGTSSVNGASGASGATSSITGSSTVYGSSGGGGGGGGSLSTSNGVGGAAVYGSGSGGSGGTSGSDGDAGGGASAAYGCGGGGGGGAGTNEANDFFGGAGGQGTGGVVIVRYRFQQ